MNQQQLNRLVDHLQRQPEWREFEAVVTTPADSLSRGEMFEDGSDSQFIAYSTAQAVMQSVAMALRESELGCEFWDAVDAGIEEYMPGFPPMSPITDSYFYLSALLDLKFGDGRETMGEITAAILAKIGAPDLLLDLCDKLNHSRMGIYETIGVSGNRLVLRELVTDVSLLADPPTEYLGDVGTLRFVRLAPPGGSHSEYSTELTTPYILRGRTADDWAGYLQKVMPDRVVGSDGTESTKIEDRLAAVFKDDCGVQPWHEFVFLGNQGFTNAAIFLSGIPDDLASLPHGELSRAADAKSETADATTRNRPRQAILPFAPNDDADEAQHESQLSADVSGEGDDVEVEVALTQAQRRAAVELMPDQSDLFTPHRTGKKAIRFPAVGWKHLSVLASRELLREGGRRRVRLRNLRSAVDSALYSLETAPVQKSGRGTEFDIHEDFFAGGEFDEELFESWARHLENEFLRSPEYEALPPGVYGCVECLLRCAVGHLAKSLTKLSVSDLHTILFRIIPSKVLMDPGDAEDVIREFRAFFRFLRRNYAVTAARPLADALDDQCTEQFARKLANPANFSLSKTLLSSAQSNGYDITSQHGLDEFITDFEANLTQMGNTNDSQDPGGPLPEPVHTIYRDAPRVGRNDPCPCGSGKKYKRCCQHARR